MPRLKIWDSVNNVWQYVDNTNYTNLSMVTASYTFTASYAISGPDSSSYANTASVATYGSQQLRATSVNFIIDGGGSAISSLGNKGYVQVPYSMSFTGWTLMGDTAGSCVVDVRKCTYTGFPTTTSITGSEAPTLSSAQKNQDTNLTTWTSVNTNDILEFYLVSCATLSRISITLWGYRI